MQYSPLASVPLMAWPAAVCQRWSELITKTHCEYSEHSLCIEHGSQHFPCIASQSSQHPQGEDAIITTCILQK